jgi:hypothetical protein
MGRGLEQLIDLNLSQVLQLSKGLGLAHGGTE